MFFELWHLEIVLVIGEASRWASYPDELGRFRIFGKEYAKL